MKIIQKIVSHLCKGIDTLFVMSGVPHGGAIMLQTCIVCVIAGIQTLILFLSVPSIWESVKYDEINFYVAPAVTGILFVIFNFIVIDTIGAKRYRKQHADPIRKE